MIVFDSAVVILTVYSGVYNVSLGLHHLVLVLTVPTIGLVSDCTIVFVFDCTSGLVSDCVFVVVLPRSSR